jgi:transposase
MARTRIDLLAFFSAAEALRSLLGIGPVLALTIVAEGRDLRRSSLHRQLLRLDASELYPSIRKAPATNSL